MLHHGEKDYEDTKYISINYDDAICHTGISIRSDSECGQSNDGWLYRIDTDKRIRSARDGSDGYYTHV